MLATLAALALAADPVIAFGKLDVQGVPPELAVALVSVLEDDLAQLTDGVRTQAETKKAGARAAKYVVTGALTAVGKSGRITLRVVDVASRALRGTASSAVTDGRWGADRGPLLRAICQAAGVDGLGEPKTQEYPTDVLLEWGRALQKGTPSAIDEFAKQRPDIGPAQRRVAK